jgi:hypothetical protein
VFRVALIRQRGSQDRIYNRWRVPRDTTYNMKASDKEWFFADSEPFPRVIHPLGLGYRWPSQTALVIDLYSELRKAGNMAPQGIQTPKTAVANQLGSGHGRLAAELLMIPRVVRPKR